MTHRVPARLYAERLGVRRDVTVSLTYDGDDPLAVHLSFPSAVSCDGNPVTWIFARDLLATGLYVPAGAGDVRVWPHDERWVAVKLIAPLGYALVELDRRGLRHFLAHAFKAVPPTRESRRLDVDALIEALLATGSSDDSGGRQS
ncbi:SsgA family sporulation/cell division regulator [Streptomyces sp. 21So2-11]|uniref:SsgA family sporulation/cell division regulator n=1 Tax=Streptomyces sp. 21So2-11 TaxID=3144408 RepID=UPI00321BC40D